MVKTQKTIGVILMTYGSPLTPEDVPEYIKKVYRGKTLEGSIIEEFQRRYRLIGGSPLIRITKNQARALEVLLNTDNNDDTLYIVTAGMRFSEPFIYDVANEMASEVSHIIGIIMSPQYSSIIMKGYVDSLDVALRDTSIKYSVVAEWYDNPYFVKAVSERVNQALDKYPKGIQNNIKILFSAHSMPKRIVDKEPYYIDHLKKTASSIAIESGLNKKQWMFCYQSAGHTQEEWLKPDFADVMPQLKSQGISHILIAPIQFLSDHLETLYDIEIAARKQAEQYGIFFKRIESLNTSPLFIKTLSDVVHHANKQL